MKSLACGVVWWPTLDKEIETIVRSCSKCQGQQDDPPTVPLIPWSWTTRPWSRLHIDYLGPFLGHMWLLIIDTHSKWIKVFQKSSTSSSATIRKLQEVFSCFGLPDRIISDNASNFVSAEFKEFMMKNGIKHSTFAPYHPASNDLAERAVKTFKAGMER